MTLHLTSISSLQGFLALNKPVVQILLTRVRGSSPRNEGTRMFVAQDAIRGTIGGGQLEFIAINAAREMLQTGAVRHSLLTPLGPEIGQCCGGHVEMNLTRMTAADKSAAIKKAVRNEAELPNVFILGAGHVGRALADQLQHLPVKCHLLDSRSDEIALCTANVEKRVCAIPEAEVRTAPAGSAFVVLTHDHSLDFLLASEALKRQDAAYVGMIGSVTKRAKFNNWALNHNSPQTRERLVCPIGAGGSGDKRPSVIAAFVVAEVLTYLKLEAQPTSSRVRAH